MHLKLKPGSRYRVLRGHPWVFAGEVVRLLPEIHDGSAVDLLDSRGRVLGSGIYNSRSQIVWRRFSRQGGVDFSPETIEGAIRKALSKREEEPYRRLVWSEADNLPGLVVDQFGDILVLQALTLAVDLRVEPILAILRNMVPSKDIVLRNDAPSRRYEGLEGKVSTASGERVPEGWYTIGGIDYRLDLMEGQKTGFYLDQRREHTEVASLADGRSVLDGFCNLGAFALNCMRSGARSATAIEISGACSASAAMIADRNGLQVDIRTENMFDYFTEHRSDRFELIILDPPSFAPNRAALPGARRGYKELNLRAFRMLESGGILATYCCSQRVGRALFEDIVADAAADAGRRVRLLARSMQPSDHPVTLEFPESEYLKGMQVQVD